MYNAVGIDASKLKSTITVIQPAGIVIRKPFDVLHTSGGLLYAWFFYHFVGSLIDFMEFLWIWGVILPVSLIFMLPNILMTSQKYATMYVNKVYVMYL